MEPRCGRGATEARGWTQIAVGGSWGGPGGPEGTGPVGRIGGRGRHPVGSGGKALGSRGQVLVEGLGALAGEICATGHTVIIV
jgi:hypothetical protein